jgi:hypothetical protein
MSGINLTVSSEGAVRVVYSPDDGGYYLSEFNLHACATRVSRKVWRTESGAANAWRKGTVKWNRWH